MIRILGSFIRASAFIRNEIFVLLRQPRLLLTLIIGPFLILLLFGIGYRADPRTLRTLFIIDENNPIATQIEEYATTLGPGMAFMGITQDRTVALNRLRQGEVDVVAIAPDDAFEKVSASEPATFILYHREIDPYQVDYVNYFGKIYVDEVNRRFLLDVVEDTQSDAELFQQIVREARNNATSMRQSLQVGDTLSASLHQEELTRNIDEISLAMGASMGVVHGVEQSLDNEQGMAGDSPSILLNLIREDLQSTNLNPSLAASDEEISKVSRIEENLGTLETELDQFTNIDPNVIIGPFRSEIRNIAEIQPDATKFYAPAVVALLLQHLAVTFAGFSVVRDRRIGIIELFRVSPLSPGETLLGKYFSFLLFSGLISVALTILLFYGLKLPMQGSWWNYSLVIMTLLFTSLGIGFVISILSQTNSQAVQYMMIVLLTSVFFSGFLMDLNWLWGPVRIISWLLPTTYGSILLRNITLRGLPIDITLIAGLLVMGIILFILVWLMMRKLINSGQN
jgi:ABC-2 type transport system permease protein